MRIVELLEGRGIDNRHNQFEEPSMDGNGNKLSYNLPEDIVYFMNNQDAVYRKFVRPIIGKMINRIEAKRDTKPSMFEPAAKECYKEYIKEYHDIRSLPDKLDEKTCEEVCELIHAQVIKHVGKGHYD